MNRYFSSLSFHSRAHQIATITVVMSVIQGLLSQGGNHLFLFSPFKTLYYVQLWRPLTSLFIAVNPIEVIFGALIIYSVGGMLEQRWGRKKMVVTALGIPLVAEVVTLLLAAIFPSISNYIYAGSRQVVTSLWILFGLACHFSRERLNFWGTPITGKTFALIGLGFSVLTGVFNGFIVVLPEILSAVLCYGYMYRKTTFGFGRALELKYYDWKLKRLRGKSGLKVIKGSRYTSESDDDDDSGHHIH